MYIKGIVFDGVRNRCIIFRNCYVCQNELSE